MSELLLTKDESSKLSKILKKLSVDDEFEVMFGGYNKINSLKLDQFLEIIKYLKNYADEKKLKLEHHETLDILYNYDSKNFHTYRISINGVDNINKHLASIYNHQNNIIFSTLVAKIFNSTDESISIINKKRDFENTYNLDSYDMRIRLSKEESVSKNKIKELINLQNVNKMDILFRMKSRLSLILDDNKNYTLRLDLTSVRQSIKINSIQQVAPNYELELEFLKKKDISVNYEKQILEYMNLFKKIVNQSNYIITLDEKKEVLDLYQRLLLGDISSNQLYGMNVISLEVVHLVDKLPNKYALCDKADGDRCMGIIHNQKLYLIFTNLNVKFSGVTISDKKYNNTIVDGEYIFNADQNKYIFTTWDILYYQNNDMRSEENLEKRIEKLLDVTNNCFNFKFNLKKYSGNFNLEVISDYYQKDIVKYLNELTDGLKKEKNETFVCNKYFIFPLGGLSCEIYKYSDILWNIYTKSHSDKVPYILDGLIYTPISQIYTNVGSQLKHSIYKWKPPNKNSIDFYVKFEKDQETGKDLIVYDNALSDEISNKTYKILNLYVGKIVNKIEIPVLFRKQENLYIAKICDEDGIVRDSEGDIIMNDSVVEFYYSSDVNSPNEFRWVPIRTRHDKTESVNKYKRKYGNFIGVADSIWQSMQENVTIDDIAKLGIEKIHENEMFEIKKRIDATVVAKEKQKDAYYQKKTDFATPLRNFHNYIKSNIIFTYCSPKNVNGKYKKLDVLDVGVGKGGDIQKFFHSKVGKYVGIDPDSFGIHSATDGAVSRYNTFRRKMPNFPKMEFIVADATSEFNFDNQSKTIGKMTTLNETLIKNTFGESNINLSNNKFDVFNCQLMFHFLLKNETTFDNFCKNVNNYLNDDGYIIITTFNGNMLHELFKKNNGKIISKYNLDGVEKTFFEFKALYDYENIKDISKTNLSYDAFVSIFNEEDTFYTEYLVTEEHIKSVLKEKCNMSLVESDTFYKIYEQQRFFFENIAPKEENINSKNFFMKISQFYNMDDNVNKASLEFSKLHKYYIFKKDHKNIPLSKEKSKVVSKKTLKPSKEKIDRKKSKNLIEKYLNSNTVIDI